MELLDLSPARGRTTRLANGASRSTVYPMGAASGLVALDLLEVEPGASTPTLETPEEHFLCVLSGAGEITGGTNGPVSQLKAGSVVHLAPREPHSLAATGRETLCVLVVTSLVVLSDRALGLQPESASPAQAAAPTHTEPPRERLYVAEPSPPRAEPASRPTPTADRRPPTVSQPEQAEEEDGPRPDLSSVGGLRRASELSGQPKPERRRPAPPPEPEPEPAPDPRSLAPDPSEEEDTGPDLMELSVVFDGGSRGNPGQGYGSYLVQSPGRKPVIKRVEFGNNYTNNQAEYESLISCLQYIVERLTATNRTPDGVGLDIKTDSEIVANQLQGNYKVKDAGLKTRHAQAQELLEQFGAWQIEWQPREETERLLGH